ncbi:unnamed protein product [Lactuca saligna]|uniref:Uncharacterized protein n=1 Tax=Lactuca saligna TaxID=75948 RepID=A0AA35V265_LACSI|nr:unnamed protein product [Lactuca saligna]
MYFEYQVPFLFLNSVRYRYEIGIWDKLFIPCFSIVRSDGKKGDWDGSAGDDERRCFAVNFGDGIVDFDGCFPLSLIILSMLLPSPSRLSPYPSYQRSFIPSSLAFFSLSSPFPSPCISGHVFTNSTKRTRAFNHISVNRVEPPLIKDSKGIARAPGYRSCQWTKSYQHHVALQFYIQKQEGTSIASLP